MNSTPAATNSASIAWFPSYLRRTGRSGVPNDDKGEAPNYFNLIAFAP